MEIVIVNEAKDRSIYRYKKDYECILQRTSDILNRHKDWSLSVIFVTPEQIHEINKEYRKIDRPTDVISFALQDDLSDVFPAVFLFFPAETEPDVSLHSKPRHQAGLLEDESHPAGRAAGGVPGICRFRIVIKDLSGIRRFQAAGKAQERGLSAAASSQDHGNLLTGEG